MSIKSLIKHNLYDNNCDRYQTVVSLLHSSHYFYPVASQKSSSDIKWTSIILQEEIRVPTTDSLSLERTDTCHVFPIGDIYTNLGNVRVVLNADVGTNNRLQESIMPIEANRIIL